MHWTTHIPGLPWSMQNAYQCRAKFWQWSQCLSIPLNARSSRIDPVMFYWCLDPALRGIDQNWSTLIGIKRHFGLMPWFWSALIGIDRHWATLGIDRGSSDVHLRMKSNFLCDPHHFSMFCWSQQTTISENELDVPSPLDTGFSRESHVQGNYNWVQLWSNNL